MAVNDSIVSLIDDIVSGLRNNGTIISESFANDVLTLELTNLYDLAVNKYIEVGGTNYKIIALDSGASTVDVIASGLTGETIYTVPTPYFWNGTMQMINKRLKGDNDNFAKYPAILLVDVFRTTRITDPTSPYFSEPRIFIAFLKESLIDYGSDLQNPIINEMQELAEDFISACQANPFIGRFDEFEITRHANFGVYATDRGHISTIIDEQLSGVVVEVTLPIYENFEDCNGNVLTAIKCAPGLIKDSDGNLIQELPAGETYVVAGGGGDVEIYDTDSNLLYTVTAPDSQIVQDSVNRLYLNSVLVFPISSAIETVNILAEGTEVTVINVENTSGSDVGSAVSGNVIISDSTIENSDQSYSSTVVAEGTLILPDINFTDSDGTTTSVPSVQDIVSTACPSYPVSYVRPKIAIRITNFDTYDAGYWLAQGAYDQDSAIGIKKILDTNNSSMLAAIAGNENEFGNFERYTNDVGGSVKDGSDGSTAGYIIDHYTGKGWGTEVYFNNRNWATSMDYIQNTFTLGVYTGFRAPCIEEYQQTTSGNGGQSSLPFTSANNIFWLCNSINASTAFICRAGNAVQSATPLFDDFNKLSTSTSVFVRVIRNHYY